MIKKIINEKRKGAERHGDIEREVDGERERERDRQRVKQRGQSFCLLGC